MFSNKYIVMILTVLFFLFAVPAYAGGRSGTTPSPSHFFLLANALFIGYFFFKGRPKDDS